MFLFSVFALLGMSRVALAQETPPNASCNTEGDASPLLQVHAKDSDSPWCSTKSCHDKKKWCLEDNKCCSSAKACAIGGGGGGGGKKGPKPGKPGPNRYQTDITQKFNNKIKATNKVYEGGVGVIFRNQNDGFFGVDAFKVLPGSLIVNDIFAPNPAYPTDPLGQIDSDQAVLGVILDDTAFNLLFGLDTQDYSYKAGVFYASDSNAVDKRCRNEESQNQYDCRLDPTDPGARGFIDQSTNAFTASDSAVGTAGFGMGNPYVVGGDSGGGTGCHADTNANGDAEINQLNARGDFDGQSDVNIAKNYDCQCNDQFVDYADCKPYIYSGHPKQSNCWDRWVDHWLQYGGSDIPGGFPASIGFRDNAACWMNNIRSMINLQNWFWLKRAEWTTDSDPHTYWGWNEIPVSKYITDDSQYHESLAIVLPEGVGSLNDFSTSQIDNLVAAMDWYVKKGYLVPGVDNVRKRPGSYVVQIKQIEDNNGNYGQYFFCQDMDLVKYKIVFSRVTKKDTGTCYIDGPF